MAHTVHYLEVLSYRADYPDAYLRVHLWQKARRAPMVADVVVDWRMLQHLLSMMEDQKEKREQGELY